MANSVYTNGLTIVEKSVPNNRVGINSLTVIEKPTIGNIVHTNGFQVVYRNTNIINLVNPGAENGDTSGWTGDGDVRSSSPSPHSGSYYFYGAALATSSLTQTVDLTSAQLSLVQTGDYVIICDFYQASYASNDKAQIIVDLLDSSDSTILSFQSPMETATALTWEHKTIRSTAPSDTAKIKITMNFERDSGTNSDGYIDDIVVYIAPRPTAEGITNGGAEDGDLTGWYSDFGAPGVGTSSPAPYAGSYYLTLDSGGSTSNERYSQISQFVTFNSADLANIQAGGADFTLTYYQAGVDAVSDPLDVTLNFIGSDGALLHTTSSGELYGGAGTWLEKTLSQLSLDTDVVAFQLILTGRKTSGTTLDAYVDSISYTVEGAPSISVYGMKASLYAVLEGQTSAYKNSLYVVMSPGPRVFGYKNSVYALLQPQVSAFKTSVYVVMDTGPQMHGLKAATYAVLEPPPPSFFGFKTSTYALLEPKPPVSGTKNSIYAVLEPPPPACFGYKTSTYALLEPKPPVVGYKNSLYAVLEPIPPVVGYKNSVYAVLQPPPLAARGTKTVLYVVVGGGNVSATKASMYAIMVPLGSTGMRGTKCTTYAVLEPPAPAYTARRPIVNLLGW